MQAMDTVQDLVRKETNLEVNRFMVTGGSKVNELQSLLSCQRRVTLTQ